LLSGVFVALLEMRCVLNQECPFLIAERGPRVDLGDTFITEVIDFHGFTSSLDVGFPNSFVSLWLGWLGIE
jgi:hypothetical protein